MSETLTKTTDFAAPVDRTLYEAPGRPARAPVAHPSAVPIGAPVALVKAAEPDMVDNSKPPPSLALPVARTVNVPSAAPLPGTVPNTVDDPWRPLQSLPGPGYVAPPLAPDTGGGYGSLDAALTAAQFVTVARSRSRLDRAKAYADRLTAHADEIHARLTSATENNVVAAISRSELQTVGVEAIRGELVEVQRQHRQALAILADVEAEHARHEADLAALTGSDGAARARLAEAHAARALAQAAANAAKGILDRAMAHRDAVSRKLGSARADEARHDADATARLRAALADGDVPPAATEAFVRTSPALEDDLRAATAAVETLKAGHAGKVDALASANRAVLAAVDGVLTVDAEAVARELQAADARALALRVRLHCYAKRPAGDYVPPAPKPAKLLPNGMYEPHPDTVRASLMRAPPVPSTPVINAAIASAPPPPHQGIYDQNWTSETAAWSVYAAALAADPQAEPEFADAPVVSPTAPLPVRAA